MDRPPLLTAQRNRVVRGRVSPPQKWSYCCVYNPPMLWGKTESPVIGQEKKEENSVKMEDKDIDKNLQLSGDNVCSSGFYHQCGKDGLAA